MPIYHSIGCLIAKRFLRRAGRKTLKEIRDLGSPFGIPPSNYSNFTQGGAGFDYKTFMADELKWLHEDREELKQKLKEEEELKQSMEEEKEPIVNQMLVQEEESSEF